MGAQTTYTEEKAAEIVERISTGETLRAICRDDHMPAWRTVYDWIESNKSFAAAIARARELGFDAIAEETIEMLDEAPERCETQFGNKVDPGHVQWQKNRAEQRLKLLAKWSPKKYGDKIEIAGSLEVGVAERLARARKRTTTPEDDGSDLAG
jgi:hypothetical protein